MRSTYTRGFTITETYCNSRKGVVRSPGFEPGSSAWQADVLAKLDYDRSEDGLRILRCLLLKSVMFLRVILA
jgi:hypothetical protein